MDEKMERIEGREERGRRQEEGVAGGLGGKWNMTEVKRSQNGTVALRVGARRWCDSNLMVGRYSMAGPDGLEKSMMTSSWQHHPNLFLIYTLHIMHSYSMTRKNKRLKKTGMIRGYSCRWRNEKHADGFPSEQKKINGESDCEHMIIYLKEHKRWFCHHLITLMLPNPFDFLLRDTKSTFLKNILPVNFYIVKVNMNWD